MTVREAILLGGFLLAGCAATQQQVATKLGEQYVGKNIDVLVVQFGPPVSQFRMNSGDTSYVWQITSVTSINVDSNRYGSSGTAKTYFCKVSVVASPTGIITRLSTEDSSGTGGLLGAVGVDIYGSVCAQHLGMKRES